MPEWSKPPLALFDLNRQRSSPELGRQKLWEAKSARSHGQLRCDRSFGPCSGPTSPLSAWASTDAAARVAGASGGQTASRSTRSVVSEVSASPYGDSWSGCHDSADQLSGIHLLRLGPGDQICRTVRGIAAPAVEHRAVDGLIDPGHRRRGTGLRSSSNRAEEPFREQVTGREAPLRASVSLVVRPVLRPATDARPAARPLPDKFCVATRIRSVRPRRGVSSGRYTVARSGGPTNGRRGAVQNPKQSVQPDLLLPLALPLTCQNGP